MDRLPSSFAVFKVLFALSVLVVAAPLESQCCESCRHLVRQASAEALFEDVAASQDEASSSFEASGNKRFHVNHDALPAIPGGQRRVSFEAEGTSYVTNIRRLESQIAGSPSAHVFDGEVEGIPGSTVTLARRGDVYAGYVTLFDGDHQLSYSMKRDADGAYFFDKHGSGEHSCSCMCEHGCCLHHEEDAELSDAPDPTAESALEVRGASSSVVAAPEDEPYLHTIDLLVGYHHTAATNQEDLQVVLAKIDAFVSWSNLAFLESEINVRFRLVHTHKCVFSSSYNTNQILQHLFDPSDGVMDEMYDLREQWGADQMVVLWDSISGGNAGVAYLGGDVATLGVNNGPLTFAHELGHNLGLKHKHGNNQSDWFINCGHAFGGNNQKTIMFGAGGVRRFSNPNVFYNDRATGVEAPSPDAANAAKYINDISGPFTAAKRATEVVVRIKGGSRTLSDLDGDGSVVAHLEAEVKYPLDYATAWTITNLETSIEVASTSDPDSWTMNLPLGVYEVRFQVGAATPSAGIHEVFEDFVTIEIAPNQPPQALFQLPSTVLVSQKVSLDGSLSFDPDGFIESYQWFIDGESVSGDLRTAIPLPLGAHTIELFVSDNGNPLYPESHRVGQCSKSVLVVPSTLRVPQEYATIQDAIDAAGDGSTILVAPGTYRGEGNYNIKLWGKGVHLKSESGPEATVIDCESSRDGAVKLGFVLYDDEGRDTIIEGFTIMNGLSDFGGAIRCVGSSPTIRHNTLINNNAIVSGGAICSIVGSPLIQYNRVTQNEAFSGGGIYAENSSLTIADNLIVDNTSTTYGGGIYSGATFGSTISPRLERNTLTDNIAYDGGGAIYVQYGKHVVANNTICNNEARDGAGVYSQGGHLIFEKNQVASNRAFWSGGGVYLRSYVSAPTVVRSNLIVDNEAMQNGGVYCSVSGTIDIVNNTIANNFASQESLTSRGGLLVALYYEGRLNVHNNIIWGNESDSGGESEFGLCALDLSNHKVSVHWNNIRGGWDGVGNIDADPLFDQDSESGYELLMASPCIDAASGTHGHAADIGGHSPVDIPDVVNTGVGTPDYLDIGAFERALVRSGR